MTRKKRDTEEIEATAAELPLTPPDEIVEIIKKRQRATKLVYRASYYTDPLTGLKHKTALVSCTACGEKYHLDYTHAIPKCSNGYGGDSFGFIDPLDSEAKRTGSTCICPECGAAAEGLHIGKIHGKIYDIERNYFVTVHNIRGHFAALSWVLFKECDKEANVYYTLRRYEGVVTIGGMPVRYTGCIKNMYYGMTWLVKWEPRAVWRDNADEWDRDEIFLDNNALESSDASKNAFDVFIKDGGKKLRIAAYIQLWTRYPQIENLVRIGLSPFVSKLINEATNQSSYTARTFSINEIKKYIDVKKVKPSEIVGLPKEELSLANELKLQTLVFYRNTFRDRRIRLTKEQLKAVDSLGVSSFRRLLEEEQENGFNPPLVRTLNYLVKQRKKNGTIIDPYYLRDYWNMIREIQNGLPEELRYPSDLLRAHDLAVLRKKEKINREINQGIKAFAETLDWLTFEDNEIGLFIRACRSQEELIKEGKLLSHCVGGYAKDVSQGKTCILFIRRISEPEIPFFTLEYQNGKVVQNRGFKNCERTPEVILFENKWLKYIKDKEKEKGREGKWKTI